MKKYVFLTLFLTFIFTNVANAGGVAIVGANLGFQSLMADEDDSGIKQQAFMYGLTGKFFFGNEDKRTFGIGGTYNKATHETGDFLKDYGIKDEWEFTTTSLDLMYNFGKDPDFLAYIIGSLGSIDIDAEVSANAGPLGNINVDASATGTFWAIGVGGMTAKKGDFCFGGEVKYIGGDFAMGGTEDEGFIQAYLTAGYAF